MHKSKLGQPCAGGLSFRCGHESQQGLRPTMEDEVVIKECFSIPARGHYSFFGVFDGHGGRSAAIFAREHVYLHLHSALSSGLDPAAALAQAYLNTDASFIAMCRANEEKEQQHKLQAAAAAASAHAALHPAALLPLPDALPHRRQQSANLCIHLPVASLPASNASVAAARASSEMVSSSSGSGAEAEKDNSGTTAVCVLIHHESYTLYAANCGDSRAVLSTSNSAIMTLTNDHKADRADEADRIRRAGGFVVHKRVMGELAISRAIGDLDFKEIGFQFVLAHPEIAIQPLCARDDFLLLACDGIFDVLSNEQACAFVREQIAAGKTLDQAAAAIVKHAIDTLNSRDNVTVVLVKLPPSAELEAAQLARLDAPTLAAGSTTAAQLHDSHVATPIAAASPAPAQAAATAATAAATTPLGGRSPFTPDRIAAAAAAHAHETPLAAAFPTTPAPSTPAPATPAAVPAPLVVPAPAASAAAAAAPRSSLSPRHSSTSSASVDRELSEGGSGIQFHDDNMDDAPECSTSESKQQAAQAESSTPHARRKSDEKECAAQNNHSAEAVQ